MERDVVLPPPALVPYLPHCVATTIFHGIDLIPPPELSLK